MDMRTIVTLGTTVILIAAGFAFLLFNPSAKEASQKNIESSAQEIADETMGKPKNQ